MMGGAGFVLPGELCEALVLRWPYVRLTLVRPRKTEPFWPICGLTRCLTGFESEEWQAFPPQETFERLNAGP